MTLLKTGSPGEVQSFVLKLLKPELFQRTVFTWRVQNSPHKQRILLQITDHQQGHIQKETSLCRKHTLRMSVHAPNRRERCKTQESRLQCLIKTIPPLQDNMSPFQYVHKTSGSSATGRQTSCPRHQNTTLDTNEIRGWCNPVLYSNCLEKR